MGLLQSRDPILCMNSSDPKIRLPRYFPVVALTFAVLGSFSMLHYYLDEFMPKVLGAHAAMNWAGGYEFGHDFYPIWLTSRNCFQRSCNLYSPEMTREIQRGLFGRPFDLMTASHPPTDYRTFTYPAFTVLLFWPVGELPFTTIRVIVVLLLAVLTIASAILWMKAISWRPPPLIVAAIALLVVCSYPVLEGLYAGQLGLLVGFFFASALFAFRRGRLLLSGIMLALTTIKPQMTILAACYLLVWSLHHRRQYGRFCTSFFSTTFALGAAAILVWPHWIRSWINVILGYHHYSKPPLVSEVLVVPLGLNPNGPASLAMILLLVLLSVTVSWKQRMTDSGSVVFWLTLSFSLCITTVALFPSDGFQDQVILLPAIFLLSHARKGFSSSWTLRVLLAAGAGILLWPWLAAIILIVARPLLSEQAFYSRAVFALPVRTAAAFPFALLGAITLGYRGAVAGLNLKSRDSSLSTC